MTKAAGEHDGAGFDLDYKDAMELIATDWLRGRLYKCPICGWQGWTVFGRPRKHWEYERRFWLGLEDGDG